MESLYRRENSEILIHIHNGWVCNPTVYGCNGTCKIMSTVSATLIRIVSFIFIGSTPKSYFVRTLCIELDGIIIIIYVFDYLWVAEGSVIHHFAGPAPIGIDIDQNLTRFFFHFCFHFIPANPIYAARFILGMKKGRYKE